MDTTGQGRGNKHAWWVAVVAGMASYIDSAAIVSSGTALVIYQEALGITPGEVGTLSSALTICIAIGALVGGRLGDRFGRKRVFLATMLVITVGCAVLVFASSVELLAVGVVLVGLGTGADLPVSLATIAEVARGANRGRLVSFSQILWTVGILASQALGTFVGDFGRIGGQLMFAHVGGVALLVLLLRLSVPESQQWIQAHNSATTQSDSAGSPKASLKLLLAKPYLAPFIGLLVFYALTNLAANTNGQFGTYMFVNVGGISVSAYSALSFGMTGFGILVILLFMKVVDGKNRMNWFAAGAVCGIVGFAVPALFGVGLPNLVFQLLMMQVLSAFAFEPIMKVWAQESFPTLLRTTAQGAVIAVARVLAAGLGLVTPMILESGPQLLFVFLTAVVLIGTATAYVVFRKYGRNEFRAEDVEANPVT